jgi:hypothetical protein
VTYLVLKLLASMPALCVPGMRGIGDLAAGLTKMVCVGLQAVCVCVPHKSVM